MKELGKNRRRYVQLMFIGASAHPMVASPPLLGDSCGIVPVHCRGHRNGQSFWYIFHHRFVCCCPGGRWGNTEWVVARWRQPVASGVALDMPHWTMPSVLLRRTAMAIKTAGRRGAFVRHCRLVCIIIYSYKTMLWSIKTKDELTKCLLLCLELVRIL
jgi:hypothetical protein